MTGSENQGNSKAEVESVLAEFDGKRDDLSTFCERTKTLIEEFLEDAKIQFQSVQARVKKREKLRRKYLDPNKDYKRLNDITDQVALRIITYYEDEVDRVAEIIKEEFDIDPKNSVDKRDTEPDKFGYYALNYVCKYSKGRTSHVEYKKFAGVCCEIQIMSVLRHAWSEMEHPWYDLKNAFPDNIKRRFARMAALLEVAESEFLSLRKIQLDYQQSVKVQVEAEVPDLPVDAVSLKSFIEQDPLIADTDRSIAQVSGRKLLEELPDAAVRIVSMACRLAGMTTLQHVRDSLKRYSTVIPEYVRRCRQEGVWPPLAPGLPLARSLSLYHLAGIVVSLRGRAALVEFYQALVVDATVDVSLDPDRQAAIAQEIVAKQSS